MTDRHDATWRRASARYAWSVVIVAAWLVAGLALIDRADFEGLLADVAVSPYHLPAYAGLAVLGVYVVITIDRGELRNRSWRRSFPRHYDGLVLGLVAAMAWLALDLLWRGSIGIRPGIEGILAPTRLLVPVGLGLVASGPLRDALAGPGDGGGAARTSPSIGAAIVATGLVAVAGGVLLGAFNPVSHSLGARPETPARDVSEIWAMAADGSHQTRLLPAPGGGVDYSLPAWSPDGTRIAYTRWRNAPGVALNETPGGQTSSIWTMRADGTDPREVIDGSPGQDWVPAWSPDGAWIAFTLSRAGTGGESAAPGSTPLPSPNLPPGSVGPPPAPVGDAIWIVHPDGTDPTRLLDEPASRNGTAWSPDGRRIAFGSDMTGDFEVWVMSADGSDQTRLTHDPANDGTPTWSPDGSRIAFSSNRTGTFQIWVMNADGTSTTQLTHAAANDWVPAWSPDGSRIAFTSDRGGGAADVWSMAADGTDARDLTDSPERVDGQWSVAWSPDGRQLAYASAAALQAADDPLVTEDLAVAGTLFFAALFAVAALVLVRLGAVASTGAGSRSGRGSGSGSGVPFGAFALVLVMNVAFAAFVSGEWRFLPAAVALGLSVDVAVRVAPARWSAFAAATGLPIALVLSVGLTLAIVGDLGWSPTLLSGVAVTAGLVGSTLATASRLGLPRGSEGS